MTMTAPTGDQILRVEMGANDADAVTVRDYLVALLRGVWLHREEFDGKRPFGNSGWQFELFTALGHVGLIDAEFDAEGFLDTVDDSAGDRLINLAINTLGQA